MPEPRSGRPALNEPRLSALYDYWQAKRAGRAMPARADIDPLEMKSWLGHLLLIEITGPGRFLYRLYGTAFVDSFGVDMTGKAVDELAPELQERVRGDYEAVWRSGQPRARLYTASFEAQPLGASRPAQAEVATWERLVLPLSDGKGAVVMLLVGAYPLADLQPSTPMVPASAR